eukprot:comp22028_c0_seq4/m.50737 comp22028_c0_seq4/g.50737  ORF comp22028_c0_seq4/g.50737 comp22028_c0_seq4/m.50737 type:complete len:297 (-) comp22028_c0_seq4:131-1021(-)
MRRSIQHAMLKEMRGFVRGEIKFAGYYIEPMSNGNGCTLTYVLLVDPKGWVIGLVANSMASDEVFTRLINIRKYLDAHPFLQDRRLEVNAPGHMPLSRTGNVSTHDLDPHHPPPAPVSVHHPPPPSHQPNPYAVAFNHKAGRSARDIRYAEEFDWFHAPWRIFGEGGYGYNPRAHGNPDAGMLSLGLNRAYTNNAKLPGYDPVTGYRTGSAFGHETNALSNVPGPSDHAFPLTTGPRSSQHYIPPNPYLATTERVGRHIRPEFYDVHLHRDRNMNRNRAHHEDITYNLNMHGRINP